MKKSTMIILMCYSWSVESHITQLKYQEDFQAHKKLEIDTYKYKEAILTENPCILDLSWEISFQDFEKERFFSSYHTPLDLDPSTNIFVRIRGPTLFFLDFFGLLFG